MLKDKYYSIVSNSYSDNDKLVKIELHKNHPVYRGHFPNKPVSPGVFGLQMIKECIEETLGKQVMITVISQLKFINVMTPENNTILDIEYNINEKCDRTYTVTANIHNETMQYIAFKGELITEA